jgi:lipopolysaccharide biosynthesis regulator YciM
MNNKKIFCLLVVVLLAVVFYFFGRPIVANNYAKKAIDTYLDNRQDNDQQKLQSALNYLVTANRWGRDDTNLGILKGQLLVALGRKSEAITQYELVKTEDPSAIAAVDELLKEIK